MLEWVPFYIQYSVARKMVLDKLVSPEEWNELGIDSVLAAIPFGKLAKTGGKVVTQTLKSAVKEEAGQRLARRATAIAAKGAAEELASGTMKAATRTVSGRMIVRWTVTEAIRSARRAAKSAPDSVSRRLAVDITKPVRFFYHHSGLGRAHVKRLTALEARIFMRPDGRVLFHLDRFALERVREYLKATAKGALLTVVAGEIPPTDVAGNVPDPASNSGPKRTTIQDGGTVQLSPSRRTSTDEVDLEQARRNASAMFLLEVAGLLDGPDPTAPGTR